MKALRGLAGEPRPGIFISTLDWSRLALIQGCMQKATKRIRAKTRKLPRFLAEPVVVKSYHPTLVGFTADEAKKNNDEEFARVVELLATKLELLFDFFSIPRIGNLTDDYRALSLALAAQCFHGFQLVPAGAPRPGRPAHDSMFLLGLLVDVEQKKRLMRGACSEVSDAKALAALTRDPRFRERWGRYTPRTLANLLSRAHDPALNTLYSVWSRKGQAGKLARQALATVVAASRKPPPDFP